MFKKIVLGLFAVATVAACKTNKSTTMNSDPNAVQLGGQNVAFPLPEWAKSATIYEVNVRQFSNEGTFSAVTNEIPRLKAMNVDILWLMPIFPISKEKRKGSIGSHYAVADFTAPNPNYGTMQDFKDLVDAAHRAGMKIILDWVPNHSGWDNKWITEHPDWYTQVNGKITDPLGEDGKSVGWEDVADLNYNNPDMRHAMIEAMRFWIREADIDGFRCDVAGFVPEDFWAECRAALDVDKKVFMLAEWEKPQHFAAPGGFNMAYGWAYHALIKEIYKGNKTAQDLENFLVNERKEYPKGFFKMLFTNNHDENSWNGTTRELFGESADCMAVLCGTLEGMPLMYNGQEAGLDRRLAFFEKDPIDWSIMSKKAFYTTLFKLKHDNEALWNGVYGGPYKRLKTSNNQDIFAFVREKNGNQVFAVFNLSNKVQRVTINGGGKTTHPYTEAFTGKSEDFGAKVTLNLGSWDYRVYVKKK